jgi:hypothetical protein
MTPTERHAIQVALATADLGRSPGLRNRLRRSLRSQRNWELITVTIGLAAFWGLVAWWLL